MFLHSNSNVWTSLSANVPIKIDKDFMIVRYINTDNFPLLTIHKPNVYKYDVEQNSVVVKVKPVRVTYKYYILHRTDNNFANLYSYSFNKAISYIMI